MQSNLKMSWLTQEDTRKILGVNDSEIKTLRETQKLSFTNLQNKLYYRLDGILAHLGVTEVTTFESTGLEVESESPTPAAAPAASQSTSEQKHSKTFIFAAHHNREWDGVVASADTPTLVLNKPDKKRQLSQEVSGYVEDIDLYDCQHGTSNEFRKLHMVLRSTRDEDKYCALQIVYAWGDDKTAFGAAHFVNLLLDMIEGVDFTKPVTIKMGSEGKYHWYSVEQGEFYRKWQNSDDFIDPVTNREITDKSIRLRSLLKNAGVYKRVITPKLDKAFLRLVELEPKKEVVNSVEDDEF